MLHEAVIGEPPPQQYGVPFVGGQSNGYNNHNNYGGSYNGNGHHNNYDDHSEVNSLIFVLFFTTIRLWCSLVKIIFLK